MTLIGTLPRESNLETYVQSIPVHRSADLIEALGGDPKAIALEADIPLQALKSDEIPIPTYNASRFLELAALSCNCRHFGILLGERLGWRNLGEAWGLMNRCDTIGSLLRALEKFLSIHNQSGLVYLEQIDDLVALQYDIRSGLGSAVVTQAIEMGLAMSASELQRVIGGKWTPEIAQFRHGKPSDLSEFHRVFGPNLQFDQDRNAIFIPENCMGIKRSNDRGPIPEQGPHNLIAKHGPPVDELEKMVRSLLINGECSLLNLGRIYQVSERQMQRLLAKQGERFQSLLTKVRKDLCIKYLVGSNLTIAQIAEILQYTDTSSLTRFARTEFGTTPRSIRNNPELLGPGLFTPEIDQLRGG
jgi:AraC-like DNA-binding protein